MAKYIDREAVMAAVEKTDWYHVSVQGNLAKGAACSAVALYKAEDIYAAVREVPAVDVEPVRHGSWKEWWPGISLILTGEEMLYQLNKAKAFFQQIRNIDKQIDAKHERLLRLNSLATKTTATIGGEGGKPTGISRTENAVDKIIDLQKELNADIERLVNLKAQANTILKRMSKETERRCLEYRFLSGMTIEATADKMGYSVSGIKKLIKSALRAAEKIMDDIAESAVGVL